MPRPKGSSNRSELVMLAIAGIDAQIQELTAKRAELVKMAPGSGSSAVSRGPGRKRAAVTSSTAAPAKKRKVTAATRRKLKEAAKARWARARGEK